MIGLSIFSKVTNKNDKSQKILVHSVTQNKTHKGKQVPFNNSSSTCPFPVNQSPEERMKWRDGTEARAADLDSVTRLSFQQVAGTVGTWDSSIKHLSSSRIPVKRSLSKNLGNSNSKEHLGFNKSARLWGVVHNWANFTGRGQVSHTAWTTSFSTNWKHAVVSTFSTKTGSLLIILDERVATLGWWR